MVQFCMKLLNTIYFCLNFQLDFFHFIQYFSCIYFAKCVQIKDNNNAFSNAINNAVIPNLIPQEFIGRGIRSLPSQSQRDQPIAICELIVCRRGWIALSKDKAELAGGWKVARSKLGRKWGMIKCNNHQCTNKVQCTSVSCFFPHYGTYSSVVLMETSEKS